MSKRLVIELLLSREGGIIWILLHDSANHLNLSRALSRYLRFQRVGSIGSVAVIILCRLLDFPYRFLPVLTDSTEL